MGKKYKLKFTFDDGSEIETDAFSVPQGPDVINNLYSWSTSAALSANQGRVIGEKLVDLDNRTRLIWQGNLTLYPGIGEYIDVAYMYPELFQEPGLFAISLMVMPPTVFDGGPFVTTVFVDTETSNYVGEGFASFSGAVFGSYDYGFESGVLMFGNIFFENETGYVEFDNGYFYDFGELEGPGSLSPNNLGEIEIFAIHRITRAIDYAGG